MRVVQTEKVFLTINEFNLINQFDSLIMEINRVAESEDLRKVCDNVLVKIAELADYLFSE